MQSLDRLFGNLSDSGVEQSFNPRDYLLVRMMGKVSAMVVWSLRMSSELGSSISQKGFERDHRIVDSFRHYSQSPGPPSSTGTAAAEKPIGRQSEPTSTSGFDTGGEVGVEQKHAPKKSRTGGDMSDEGQVHTPNLQKMRSTRDIIDNAGKEQVERLASEKKSPT